MIWIRQRPRWPPLFPSKSTVGTGHLLYTVLLFLPLITIHLTFNIFTKTFYMSLLFSPITGHTSSCNKTQLSGSNILSKNIFPSQVSSQPCYLQFDIILKLTFFRWNKPLPSYKAFMLCDANFTKPTPCILNLKICCHQR